MAKPLNFFGESQPIQLQFLRFHAKNPRIFKLFRRFSREAKNAGHKRYSADAILHRIRWHVTVETDSDDSFKINNNFSSRYARLLMDHDDEFVDFFKIRELKS